MDGVDFFVREQTQMGIKLVARSTTERSEVQCHVPGFQSGLVEHVASLPAQ